MSAGSFFTLESSGDGDWFRPTDHARGPWDEHACHAGPPTGLLARALERLLPEQRLTRITVDLLRPIPFAGFRIDAELNRAGRTVSSSRASLIDQDGKALVNAAGLHMRPQAPAELPTQQLEFGAPSDAKPGPFPLAKTLHGKPAFNGDGVELRYPDGETPLPGPTTLWMKTVPLLNFETPSPFQRICPLADCGNAFSRNAEPWQVQFINTDLSVVLHRDPDGDWLGSQSRGFWQPNGIGLAEALLFDRHGAVGHALQTLLLRPAAG